MTPDQMLDRAKRLHKTIATNDARIAERDEWLAQLHAAGHMTQREIVDQLNVVARRAGGREMTEDAVFKAIRRARERLGMPLRAGRARAGSK